MTSLAFQFSFSKEKIITINYIAQTTWYGHLHQRALLNHIQITSSIAIAVTNLNKKRNFTRKSKESKQSCNMTSIPPSHHRQIPELFKKVTIVTIPNCSEGKWNKEKMQSYYIQYHSFMSPIYVMTMQELKFRSNLGYLMDNLDWLLELGLFCARPN